MTQEQIKQTQDQEAAEVAGIAAHYEKEVDEGRNRDDAAQAQYDRETSPAWIESQGKIGTCLIADTAHGVYSCLDLDDEDGTYYEEADFYARLKDLDDGEIITTMVMSAEMYEKIESEYGIY